MAIANVARPAFAAARTEAHNFEALAMSQVVHILRGLNTPASQAITPGERVFVTLDNLSCGPLQPIDDLAAWNARRLAFWRSISDYQPAEDADEFLGDTADLIAARRIVIWLGTSLDSQLALAWLPALLRAVGASPEQIDVIQFQRNHRGVEILDLGMLNPEQFATHPALTTLTRDDLAELERTWSALTAHEPDALEAALACDYEPLPFLKRALRALLLRYPERRSGVNATERRILHWIRRDPPRAARIIGEVLGEVYDVARAGRTAGLDLCGDVWLFQRILRLGDPSLPEPAVAIGGSRRYYRDTTLRLTPFGEQVLDEKRNFVDVNGIDDWVAGVHLQSEMGRVWFNDDGHLRRAP